MQMQTRELLLRERSQQLEESRLRAAEVEKAAEEEKEIEEHLLYSDIADNVVAHPNQHCCNANHVSIKQVSVVTAFGFWTGYCEPSST